MARHCPLDFLAEKITEFMVPSVTASCPGPEPAEQPQIIKVPPPCLTVGVMLFWKVVLVLYQMWQDTHPPEISTFVSSVHRIVLKKSWGLSRLPFGKCVTGLCAPFHHQWVFALERLLPWMPFFLSLSLIVESWTLNLFWVGNYFYTQGQDGLDSFFSINKWNHFNQKSAFCISSGYLCVILHFVWWSGTCKCEQRAKTE